MGPRTCVLLWYHVLASRTSRVPQLLKAEGAGAMGQREVSGPVKPSRPPVPHNCSDAVLSQVGYAVYAVSHSHCTVPSMLGLGAAPLFSNPHVVTYMLLFTALGFGALLPTYQQKQQIDSDVQLCHDHRIISHQVLSRQ